jgi:hypothetical protein
MLTPIQLEEYRTIYNELPDDVDAVHERFQKNPKRLKIIRGALRIINAHYAAEDVGLFLLHRHFTCEAHRVFVERRYTPTKGHAPVLVTQAEDASNLPKRLSAHRFMFDEEGRAQALEFTTDVTAGASSRRFLMKAELIRELHAYLSAEGAVPVLGAGIFVRTGPTGKATRVFLEETDFVNRKSVVHLLPRLPRAAGRAIPTLWTYSENAFGCCAGQCVAYCSQHDNPGSFGGYCGHRHSGGHMVCV